MLDFLSIGVFIDGGYYAKINRALKARDRSIIRVSSLFEYITSELAMQEGLNISDCQITEAHYFRGRFRVKEAFDKNLLYNERKFEDTLIENDVVFHYKHLREVERDGHTEVLEKGVDAPKLIQDTYYEKTYAQNQILGRTLLESILFMDKACIASYITKKTMDFYGVDVKDLDGIVSQLRTTKGVEVAIFMYELETNVYKVSLRSKERVDVSRIAKYFGGGGHKKAAGLTMRGTYYDVLNNLSEQIELQL